MSTYIGKLGQLVQLRRVRTLSIDYWDGKTFQRTLEGRMRPQSRVKRNRAWSVEMAMATPSDLANIQALQDGEFGSGPFVFVPPLAPVTNMLAPDVSTCGPTSRMSALTTQGGALPLPGGFVAGRSMLNASPLVAMKFGPGNVPVIPGGTVTASAYLVGAEASVGVEFFDASGVRISGAVSPSLGIAGAAIRLSVTATVPATAVSCGVYAQKATQAARPALTWTDDLYAWGIGAGCSDSILHEFSSVLDKRIGKPSASSLSTLKFMVQEVS